MKVDFSPFTSDEDFYRAVVTQHGSDVAHVCYSRINELVRAGKPVDPHEIVEELLHKARQADVARLGLTARFPN